MEEEFSQYMEKDVNNGTMHPNDKLREIERITDARMEALCNEPNPGYNKLKTMVNCCKNVSAAKGLIVESTLWAHGRPGHQVIGGTNASLLAHQNQIINDLCVTLNVLVNQGE